jgi:hypothetical protein
MMPQTTEQRLITVGEAVAARQARRALFPSHLFADPAWDILLEMYVAALHDRQCGIETMAGTALPTKSLLRWIDALVGEGLVIITSKERPICFRLTVSGLNGMERYFAGRMARPAQQSEHW